MKVLKHKESSTAGGTYIVGRPTEKRPRVTKETRDCSTVNKMTIVFRLLSLVFTSQSRDRGIYVFSFQRWGLFWKDLSWTFFISDMIWDHLEGLVFVSTLLIGVSTGLSCTKYKVQNSLLTKQTTKIQHCYNLKLSLGVWTNLSQDSQRKSTNFICQCPAHILQASYVLIWPWFEWWCFHALQVWVSH